MGDFGSAYSSLNVLKEFDFDELKLDMSFLRPFNLRSKRIVTAIVKMAKVIDAHTLSESVETEEQFAYLRDIGCEKVQGYLFGRPMPYEDAIANVLAQGILIEVPQDRHYYDEVGKIDFLSAVPFMTRKENDAINSARQLNSISLALAEFYADGFKVLFYNTAFEKLAHSAGMFTRVFTQEMLCQLQPYHMLTRNVVNPISAELIRCGHSVPTLPFTAASWQPRKSSVDDHRTGRAMSSNAPARHTTRTRFSPWKVAAKWATMDP